MIADDITQDLAMRTMVLLRQMDSDDPNEPIWILINSKGGDVQAGWTIIDSMSLTKCPVFTVCYGEAASIAALIFANGEKGHRFMLKHARIMIHQPWAFPSSWPMKESDFAVVSDDISKTRSDIESFLADVSGNSKARIHELCENDYRMDASQAISMGFADATLE